MNITLRSATTDDAEAMRAVYAPYVEATAISFEEAVPTAKEMAHRIQATTAQYPWLVACRGAQVVGYAYAAQHRARAAYRWSVDVTAYIDRNAHRQGLGRRLYKALLTEVKALGYASAFAGITLPNAASVGLHEAMGFKPIGIYRHVGFKHGAWHDVGWWQLEIAYPDAPPEPRHALR